MQVVQFPFLEVPDIWQDSTASTSSSSPLRRTVCSSSIRHGSHMLKSSQCTFQISDSRSNPRIRFRSISPSQAEQLYSDNSHSCIDNTRSNCAEVDFGGCDQHLSSNVVGSQRSKLIANSKCPLPLAQSEMPTVRQCACRNSPSGTRGPIVVSLFAMRLLLRAVRTEALLSHRHTPRSGHQHLHLHKS